MNAFIIYMLITLAVLGAYTLFFKPIIQRKNRDRTLQKMLQLELSNDLANTSIHLNNQMVKDSMPGQFMNKVLASRQISDPANELGDSFVHSIEQILRHDATCRKSTYALYADATVYEASIHPQLQYDLSKWVNALLKQMPDNIDIQLYIQKDIFTLRIIKVLKEGVELNPEAYLNKIAYKNLPGAPTWTNDLLTVTF